MQLKLKHLITNWVLLSTALVAIATVLVTLSTALVTIATDLVTIATYLLTLVTNIESAKKCSLGTKYIRKYSFEVYSSTLSPFVAGKHRIMST